MERRMFIWMVVFALVGFSLLFPPRTFSETGKVLARVGDKTITQSDLDELIKRYQIPGRQETYDFERKKEALNKLVNSYLISAAAEQEKLDQGQAFQTKLKLYRMDLLIQEYLKKMEPSFTVTDEEVDQVMKDNPNLVPREILTLKEIMVKTEKEAEAVYQELKKGKEFSKLVSERSISKTKTRDGHLGAVSRGQLPPSLEAVAFSLKEGEFSKPVKTDDGYRILYLVSKKERGGEELKVLEKKVREKVLQIVKKNKADAALEKKVQELKKKFKVETYLDQLK